MRLPDELLATVQPDGERRPRPEHLSYPFQSARRGADYGGSQSDARHCGERQPVGERQVDLPIVATERHP